MIGAALGFRAKTGRAVAVALVLHEGALRIEWRGEVALTDPAVPETAQPYHAVMELPWSDSERAARPFLDAIEAVALREITALRDALRTRGLKLGHVGVVGSADRELARIGNPHIRAHTAEGIAFRRVLESASAKLRLPCRGFGDRTLLAAAPSELGIPARRFEHEMKALGRLAGPPWRADERAAAAAAWMSLCGRKASR